MTNIVLEGPIADVREREVKLLLELAETVNKLGEDSEEDRKRILQNANDLRDMFFLVVIVGEFNAGKSTFTNALIGDELLPMGITPTTEAIEIIRYAPEKSSKAVMREGDSIREWTHPNTGSPGVVIVDTPGNRFSFCQTRTYRQGFPEPKRPGYLPDFCQESFCPNRAPLS
jgi:ribosome biogenesis GTPase A